MYPDSINVSAHWTIFCKVVDNFGDIGVCWRLARCLALHHGISVTLRIDDPDTFLKLCPRGRLNGGCGVIDGVVIAPWEGAPAGAETADVVIEAFACELPESTVAAMAARERPPLWINLEYLSAESWTEECHLLRSPHPRLPLTKHFFFPGFTAKTGGLLREPGLFADRDRFQADAGGRKRFLQQIGCGEVADDTLVVSMFAYENPVVPELMEAWSKAGPRVLLLVPEGRILPDVARFFDVSALTAGSRHTRGLFEMIVLPFTDQNGYDRLLWACDLNFVRGEDSFVRALWAARPLVWQIYPQDDNAHRVKLDAFLQRFTAGLDAGDAARLYAFWHAWNGEGGIGAGWPAFFAMLPSLQAYCRRWAGELAKQDELATSLVKLSRAVV